MRETVGKRSKEQGTRNLCFFFLNNNYYDYYLSQRNVQSQF